MLSQSCRNLDQCARVLLPLVLFTLPAAADPLASTRWRDSVIGGGVGETASPTLTLIRQDFESLEFGRSVIRTPLRIGNRNFEHGLGTHSVGHIRIRSPQPIRHFSAWVGVDNNDRTQAGSGSVTFSVNAGDRQLFQSNVLRGGQPGQRVELDTADARELDLHVGNAGDGPACDHADWADARIVAADGSTWWLDELPAESADRSPYPFSFTYAGRPARDFLKQCRYERNKTPLGADCGQVVETWSDPAGGLRVTCTSVVYSDFAATEWLLSFENNGAADTKIIAAVNAMDVQLDTPRNQGPAYQLYRTHGGVPNPTQFDASIEDVDAKHPRKLRAGNGRSSTEEFPFFKIDAGRGSAVFAVGWSGCWKADVACRDSRSLSITAGLDKTHFLLHPGEKVRMPRILALFNAAKDTWEANARFRELVYKHYAARRAGQRLLPMLFCNTCFTRGGGWLNECNAENQISLINAYAPLGLEALLTDAGWFREGWPNGAGNWTPREDAYPQGMGPVAAAAKARGMVYGLWYEPERVMANTDLHKTHPDWLLRCREGENGTYLLNFGLPAVQEYFFNIVADFMKLPGFRFYRQDFNMDPLPYWRFTDTPDRQGVTEMKYIEGLYAYWDRIASTWPDSIREECASGGHRIDLETVMRMHLHQKTDYWFDNETDQTALWGVSQYLPNNTIVAHLRELDDYSFHSTMASSLCLGWIADGPGFDTARARRLTDRYMAVRHLLIGAWYPVLPASRAAVAWTGSQFHRADLDVGRLLAFRRMDRLAVSPR